MNAALVELTVPDGPVAIVVFGAVASIVNARDAIGALAKAPSRTENVYAPSASPLYSCESGFRHVAKVFDWPGPLSRQTGVTPGWLALKPNCTSRVFTVPVGTRGDRHRGRRVDLVGARVARRSLRPRETALVDGAPAAGGDVDRGAGRRDRQHGRLGVVSSAAASSGSVFWWPASPHWASLSRLPPSSVAAVASAQFAGETIGPPPPFTVVVLPATIEPWKRAFVFWE